MKRLLLLAACMTSIGCSSLRRLTDGPDGPPKSDPPVIRGGQLGPMPHFNIPMPANAKREDLHAFIPSNGLVTGVNGVGIDVFMKDDVSDQWFMLGEQFSAAFYYKWDRTAGTVQFYGPELSRKEYCIYVYNRA